MTLIYFYLISRAIFILCECLTHASAVILVHIAIYFFNIIIIARLSWSMLLRYVCRYQLLSFHCVIFVRLLMPHSISRFFLPAASRSIYSLTKRNRIFFFVINWKQATERVRERGNFLCGMKSIELNKRVGRMSEWDDKKIVCMYFYYLSSILARSLLSLSHSLTLDSIHQM